MADKPKANGAGEVRYLFGTGERLTAPVTIKSGGAAKADAYSVAEARDRLLPRATRLLETLDRLPAKACPEDRTVAAFTLHPQYIAKSYFPSALLAKFELEHVGSRARTIKAEKTTRKNETSAEETTELFVAAKRSAFRAFAAKLKDGRSDNFGELVRIEDLRALTPEERLKSIEPGSGAASLEVVLHAHSDDEAIIRGFFEYLDDLGLHRILIGGVMCKDCAFCPFLQIFREYWTWRGFRFCELLVQCHASEPLRRLRREQQPLVMQGRRTACPSWGQRTPASALRSSMVDLPRDTCSHRG